MSRSHFQRGTGCYECMNCKRNTRNTGVQDMDSELCPECYEAGGLENEMSDDGETPERLAEWNKYLDACEKKGGKPPRDDHWWRPKPVEKTLEGVEVRQGYGPNNLPPVANRKIEWVEQLNKERSDLYTHIQQLQSDLDELDELRARARSQSSLDDMLVDILDEDDPDLTQEELNAIALEVARQIGR